MKLDQKGKGYTEREINVLTEEFRKGTSLLELEKILKRPHYGILQKIEILYKEDPNNWSREKINLYYKEYYILHSERFASYRANSIRKAYQEAYKATNQTRLKERNAAFYQDYYTKNKERILQRNLKWKRRKKLSKNLEKILQDD